MLNILVMVCYFMQAIGRLSNGSLNGDVASLKTRKFDKSEKQIILEEFLSLRKRVQQLEGRHIPFNIQGIQSSLIRYFTSK
jgi:hypothetical protein